MDFQGIPKNNVSCRVTKSLLSYLQPSATEFEYLAKGLRYTREYLEDPSNWISAHERDLLCERAVALRNNETLMRDVGRLTSGVNGLGRIRVLVRLLGTPKLAYEHIPQYSSWFDRDLIFNIELIDDLKAKITLSKPPSMPVSRNACYYTQGVLASIPTIWDLPLAQVEEIKCMCPNKINYQGEDAPPVSTVCEYIVTWQPLPSKFSSYFSIYKLFPFLRKKAIRNIEEDLALADRKTAELSMRNQQIARIREMALDVMAPKSKEELFRTIIERIRDIPGMRFTCMLTWESENRILSVPYYSKVRNTAITAALKTVGFDLSEVLGEKPDSNVFTIDATRSNIIEKFLSRPQIRIIDSLAELMEGIWSKGFSDSVQKVGRFKNVGIIPVLIDNEFKAGIFVFTYDEIFTDILEMIWSHAHAAIRNLENIEELQSKNAELEEANQILTEARTALQETDQRYRILAENMSDAVWIMDRKLKPSWISPSAERLRGFTLEEIQAMPLNKHLTPQSLKIAMQVFGHELPKHLLNPKKDVNLIMELEFYRKDGSTVWVECHFSILRDANGKSLGILGEGRDITERKDFEDKLALAEQNFRNSLDSSPLGIQVMGPAGTLIYANQAVLDIYGYDSIEELKTPMKDRFTEESYREHLQRIAQLEAGEETPLNYEVKIIRKDGEVRHLSAAHKEVIWNNEKLYQILYQDVTEVKQMQQQLILADRLVSVGELAAGIAHEINNPLTSVMMYSEFLKDDDDLPDRVKNDIDIIHKEANRAAEIIKKMIIFARKHETYTEPVNVNDIILNTLSLRTYEHKVKNIEVRTHLTQNLPSIPGDAFQLQQVFLNIIINAEFFMYETNGEGKLDIRTDRVDHSVRISFGDNGPGIVPEHIPHLFDPFFTTKDVGKGTGLGLSICHGIIEGNNGRIYAQSDPGKGAKFIIDLPLYR